jgi:hypothetical protein
MSPRRSKEPLAAVRRQAALARALLDELEAIDPNSDATKALNAQAVEELTRLGRRILETAAVLALEDDSPRVAKFFAVEVERSSDRSEP